MMAYNAWLSETEFILKHGTRDLDLVAQSAALMLSIFLLNLYNAVI